jgi:hypothetical protein
MTVEMINRTELARLWQSILQTNPNPLFGADANRLEQREGLGDELAQPGFVGPLYRPGGILFLGKNPGKGSPPLSVGEERHLEALQNLKAASPESLLDYFEALTKTLLVETMPNWPVVQNYVHPILSEASISQESIAYMNLLKWRSEDPDPMLDRSWRAHTQEQYRLLRPAFVVFLGRGIGEKFKPVLRRYSTMRPDRIEMLRRERNDKQMPRDDTKQHMSTIAQTLHRMYGS